jgi:diguanylate cyclase (GGDEF)-like protein
MREADGALSLEEALHVIMDSMKQFFPCQSVAVVLIDDDTKELRIKISRQISYTFAKKFHRDSPSPTAERLVLELKPMLLNQVDPESDLYRELKLEHDFVSAVLAPIVKDQRGTGYIFCDRANHDEFTESDLLHLQVLGYLIGSLMEKFELIKQSRKLSQVDDASGALQYKAFIPAVATEMQRARTHDYPLALALLSVDAFRKYVDTYGIEQAHSLLAEIVEITGKCTRDMDILARFGADEFILCLSGATEDEARSKLAEISEKVSAEAVGQGDQELSLTIGALLLASESHLKARLQDVLGALGKSLADAKDRGAAQIVVGSL